jgi:hypothetical protein
LIIGCCIWIIVLGISDKAYPTSVMTRFNMAPREGHLKAIKKILDYLKTFLKGRIIIETSYTSPSEELLDDLTNCKDLYPDTEEEIPKGLLILKEPKVQMTVYINADHDHDLVTRRSFAKNLVMMNNTNQMGD